MTKDLKTLPVHFLNKTELGREEEILRDWLDVLVTETGLLVAQQKIERPPLMVAQMTGESDISRDSFVVNKYQIFFRGVAQLLSQDCSVQQCSWSCQEELQNQQQPDQEQRIIRRE